MITSVEEKTFLQSWNWGDFNERMGSDILRYGVYQDKELVATTFVFIVRAKRGSFIFLPQKFPYYFYDYECPNNYQGILP